VSETGTGMTEEVRQRCLEPFFTTKGPQGTGLGLSMVHGIVKRHQGTLEIESAWGRGTTIRVFLPGCPSQHVAPAAQPAEQVVPPARRRRVLVVDDEPVVRDVLAAYLASGGHVSEVAANGHEGLRRLQSASYDAVITDRAMPDMSGDQLAAAARRAGLTTPIVMLTGYGDLINAAGERPAGINLVLSKPVTRADLLAAIEELAGARQPAAARA
jgi:CheY-like chemotaxis protein